jgi:carboxyl-terminal processing protease
MRTRTVLALSSAGLLALGLAVGLVLHAWWQPDAATRDDLERVREVHRLLQAQYVEPVAPGALTEDAIEGFLAPLDPHSVYIDAERMERVREAFRGSFEGIGISYELVGGPAAPDTILVVSVVPGGPSDEAGLRAGDRIVAVEDTSAVGFSHDDVQAALKGPRRTDVTVTVRRPGLPQPLDVTITRDEIPLRTVDVSYLLDDETGYVKVNRFARTTHDEFVEALDGLRADGMRRLVLDLRGNAGGYMAMAVRMADEFLADGQLVVSAKSRHDRYTDADHATDDGRIEDAPVIVLVDGRSASASEIVAGALQDHDRALIVGERTFGKGLVQKQFRLDDGSALRVTIARFYTPSGRLIQTPYHAGARNAYLQVKRDQHARDDTLRARDAIVRNAPDSLRHRTDAGRVVVGGGGILPDVLVPPDTATSAFARAALRRGLVRTYARRWLDRDADALRAAWSDPYRFAARYALPDSVYAAFRAYAAAEGVPADARPPAADEAADAEAADAEAADEAADARRLRTLLKAHAARRLFGQAAWYPVANRTDPVVQRALTLWGRAGTLATRYPVRADGRTG